MPARVKHAALTSFPTKLLLLKKTISTHPTKEAQTKKPVEIYRLLNMAPRPGLEPGTNRLTVYCSFIHTFLTAIIK